MTQSGFDLCVERLPNTVRWLAAGGLHHVNKLHASVHEPESAHTACMCLNMHRLCPTNCTHARCIVRPAPDFTAGNSSWIP